MKFMKKPTDEELRKFLKESYTDLKVVFFIFIGTIVLYMIILFLNNEGLKAMQLVIFMTGILLLLIRMNVNSARTKLEIRAMKRREDYI